MEKARARTALDGETAPAGLAVRITEAPLRGMITLRGDLSGQAMRAALSAALSAAIGAQVPAQRRFTLEGETGVFWMSPDELLLSLPYGDVAEALRRIEAARAEEPLLAVDVSDARQVFRLEGAGAREVLAKGAPIDLHPGAFGVGDIRRTRVAQVAAAICQTGAAPERFEVFCFRSYADYLWRWLTASAKTGSLPGALSSAEG